MFKQMLVNGLVAGCSYALAAIGLNFFYLSGGFLSLSYGCTYVLAAYLFYASAGLMGLGVIPSLLLAFSVTVVFALLLEGAVINPLRRSASPSVLLLSSFAALIIVQNFISLVFGDQAKTLQGSHVQESYEFATIHIVPSQIAVVVVSLIIWTLAFLLLRYTNMGRRIRAVSSERELATIVGISERRVAFFGSAVGATISGVVSILAGYDNGLQPTMGFNAALFGLVAVIAGGVGSVRGALLGGVLIGVVQHLALWKLPGQWQDAIVFLTLILFLLLRPQGLLGKPLRKLTI